MHYPASLGNENENVDGRQPAAGGMCVEDQPTAVGLRPNVAVASLVAILLLGLLWRFDPAETNLPLCSFHALTGLDCPACGATRATHELLHGRLASALRYNALWVLSLPLVVYVAASEFRMLSGGRPLPGDLPRQRWFWGAAVAAALAFFVARNL